MGGLFSGRQARSYDERNTTWGAFSLDIRTLHRVGCLAPGYDLPERCFWGLLGPYPKAEIEEDGIRLSRPGRPCYQFLPLDWTPCHYGGQRPWFLCPGEVDGKPCLRRCDRLYLSRGDRESFFCRQCLGMVFETQLVSPEARAMKRARKIRIRLGGILNTCFSPFPDKPKGMHWSTYIRLAEEVNRSEEYGLSIINAKTRAVIQCAREGSISHTVTPGL